MAGARSFWAAKSDFCSIMQKFLHDEKNFLQPKNFLPSLSKLIFYTIFDIQSFWKNHEIGIKNFSMVRENFCMLQKFCTLVLQFRKTLLETRQTEKMTLFFVIVTSRRLPILGRAKQAPPSLGHTLCRRDNQPARSFYGPNKVDP